VTENAPKVIKLTDVRSSYAHVYVARAIEEGKEPRYSMDVYLDPSRKDHAAQILAIKQEVARVGKLKFPDIDVKKLEVPFFTQDEEGHPLQGHVCLKMWNLERPLVTNRNNTPTTKDDSKEKVYSGCRVNTNPTFFAWEFRNKDGKVMKRGVSANLRCVQFVEDDAAFGGRSQINPDDEFQKIGDAADAASGEEGTADPFA
jgi:hypothetical protein